MSSICCVSGPIVGVRVATVIKKQTFLDIFIWFIILKYKKRLV